MREGYKNSPLGEIPESWEVVNLNNITSLIKDGTHGTHKEVLGGTPLLSAKDISNGKICIEGEPRRISNFDFSNIHKNYKIQNNDILLTIVGSLGRLAIVRSYNNDYTFQRSVAIIRPKESVYSKFCYYFFQSDYFQKELLMRSNASAQAGLYLGELAKISILIPPFIEQQKIAEILTTVDDKIEIIQTQIENTQQLKKGLMQGLLTRGIGHTRFKDSALEEIPESWEVVNLNNITSLIKDGTHGTHKEVLGGTPLLSAKDISNGKICIEGEPRRISNFDFSNIHKNYKIQNNDILLTIVGSLGRLAIVRSYNNDYTFQRSVAIIRPKESVYSKFCYYFFQSDYFQKELLMRSNASAQAGLYLGELAKISILIPPFIEQQKIAEILTGVDEKLDALQNKKSHFEQLKKGLMQKLLIGKIRVKT